MNILQVSTSDVGGGAEHVAWNLFQGYKQQGHRSWLGVGHQRSKAPDVLAIQQKRLHSYWGRLWFAGGDALVPLVSNVRGTGRLRGLCYRMGQPRRLLDWWKGREEFDFPASWQLLDLPPERPDIVHCHNLHGLYFDLRTLPWLSQQVPLVMTLHDAWLLSGHCAHSFQCERWKTGCGKCPDLTIPPAVRRDETAYNWHRKRDIYSESQVYVATPSHWLMRKVEESILAPAIVEAMVIPNGIDLSVFHPGDRAAARVNLDIPQGAKVLLFVANGIRRNIWKDYQTLRTALAMLAERMDGEPLMFVGLGDSGPQEHIGPVQVRFVPYERDQARIADYYRAADVYVHAARADTFPTTILEALACGTPVVATSVGGIMEQIEDGKTGFLAPPGDAITIAARIEHLLTDGQLQQALSQRAATAAAKRFNLEKQVDHYLSWYQDILRHSPVNSFPLERGSNRQVQA